MNDDEELTRLARERSRAVLAELEKEENEMKLKGLVEMFGDQPGIVVESEASARRRRTDRAIGWRWLGVGIILFWAAVFGGVLYSCEARAEGTQVYLEGEDDLGNGFKLCHYSEGVTITLRDSQLCPLSIRI